MTAKELLKTLKDGRYNVVAIRHTCADEKYDIGDICRNSYEYDFECDLSTYYTGNPVESDGTCGYGIFGLDYLDADDVEELEQAEKIIKKSIDASAFYNPSEGSAIIIAGHSYYYGNDENEVVIKNAEVIGFLD